MRNRILITLIASLVLVLGVFGISSANLQQNGMWFGATLMNIGAAQANVVVTAYDSASTASFPYTIPGGIGVNETSTVTPASIPSLPASFEGSIVASSDQPLVALVNVTNRLAGDFGTTGGTAAALYSGVDGTDADTEVFFPVVKQDFFGKTTTFYLQNAGSAAATISTEFIVDGTTYNYTTPSTVNAGQMVAVTGALAGVPASSLGSMTVTSAQPVAAVMLEHEHSVSVATVLQASGGFTSSELDQVAYCPVFKDGFFGRESAIQVQNAHSVIQDITVDFAGPNGNFSATITDVDPGASVTFLTRDEIAANGLYAATVSGSLGNVAAVTNESTLPPPASGQTSVTYKCTAEANGTTTVAYPGYKEGFFGRTSSLQVQNVGGSTATNVVVTFTDSNGTHSTHPQTIASGSAINILCASQSSNAGLFNGSQPSADGLYGVSITSDQPILAVVNEASWASVASCTPNNGSGSFDKAIANGFNQ